MEKQGAFQGVGAGPVEMEIEPPSSFHLLLTEIRAAVSLAGTCFTATIIFLATPLKARLDNLTKELG